MVERFNGRISEVVQQTRFASAEKLRQTLENHPKLYNHHIPQKALGHTTPISALKHWYKIKPELFTKRVYEHSKLDKHSVQSRHNRFVVFQLHRNTLCIHGHI